NSPRSKRFALVGTCWLVAGPLVNNRSMRAAAQLVVALLLLAGTARGREPEQPSLAGVLKTLAGKRFVDLTHEFAPGIPHWPGFPDEKRQTIYTYDKQPGMMGSGFLAEVFSHVGQWGTHVDPPAHFVKGLRTVDQIDPKEMILPLVCIDVHEECVKNPDYTLPVDRVKKWEADHGAIPPGAFVAMRTDWSKRWANRQAMQNKD